MEQSYTKIYSRTVLLFAITMCISIAMASTPIGQKNDTTYLHLQRMNKNSKPNYKGLHVTLPVIKPLNIPVSKTPPPADDKLLSNVQVYPTLVTDQINLKYVISRSVMVNIKIMDVLGNEVVNLVSQRVDPGEMKATYSLKSKLNSGFYFVRIVAGPESVIKRISIL